jgi:coenzyme F420 biosynthesis associated uncharacterized protein
MESMTLAAERLVDWKTAVVLGARTSGTGPPMAALDRARIAEDFAELVPEAETLVASFTALGPVSRPARPWVMTRNQWLQANLRAFERVLEPFAQRVLPSRPEGVVAEIRRKTLGAQLGGLLGYLSRKVLGQYDLFVPPDDEGLLYFVGPNIAGLERRHGFAPRDFRLWLSLHEVTHRLQFAGVPWLRGHVSAMVDSYLATVEVDPKRLMDSLKHAVDEVREGTVEWRGMGWIFLLMTPEQRDLFQRMQAMMSLLEGHGNFVMDAVSKDRIPSVATFKRRLQERRERPGVEKAFQKAIGFDSKVRQYDVGERFVARVVEQVGMAGFNRVWDEPANLPTLEEVGSPERWVARVGAR